MINLIEINYELEKAKIAHEQFVFCFVLSRLSGNKTCKKFNTNFPKKSVRYNSDTYNFVVDFIVKNIGRLISGEPSELIKIHVDFESKLETEINSIYSTESNAFRLDRRKETIEDLKSILDYKGFFLKLEPSDEYSAYHLTGNLKARSCVYCNRVYSVTHNTKNREKLMRPQLDHWFPKSKFPILSLSFYNLVPSCNHCNSSVKSDLVLDLKSHIHPYIKDDLNDDFSFSYFFKNRLNEFEVVINQTDVGIKHKTTLELLKIDEMYDAHQYELEDLVKLKEAYSADHLKTLKESFPNANLSDKEIYRLAFGVEYDKIDFHKRPMSKFKHDILKELGIID